jgi:hypothetical protein
MNRWAIFGRPSGTLFVSSLCVVDFFVFHPEFCKTNPFMEIAHRLGRPYLTKEQPGGEL